MKGRTITGLVLMGLMVTAGAFAQGTDYRSRSAANGYEADRYSGTRYDNNTYNYNRNNDRGYGDDRYDYNRYGSTRQYDKRTQRQMRRSDRNRSRNSGYNLGRVETYRNNDRDNDQYINNIYGNTTGMDRGYGAERYDYNRYGSSRKYDKQAQRQMRRENRNRYNTSRYGASGYDYTPTSPVRYGNDGYGYGNSRSNRNTGYMNTRSESYRNYNRPLWDNRTSGAQMPEGLMDYDTWMRNRNNTTRLDDQQLDQQRSRPEYRQQEQRRGTSNSPRW